MIWEEGGLSWNDKLLKVPKQYHVYLLKDRSCFLALKLNPSNLQLISLVFTVTDGPQWQENHQGPTSNLITFCSRKEQHSTLYYLYLFNMTESTRLVFYGK